MPKRILSGTVTSDKNEQTVTVLVERRFTHPVMKKTVRRSKKYRAHDAENASKVGDIVLGRADTCVWLDLPRRVVMPRIIRRTLRRGLTREELWNRNRESVRYWFDRDPETNIILWSWKQVDVYREQYGAAMADPANAPEIPPFPVILSTYDTNGDRKLSEEERDVRVAIDRSTGEYETFRRWEVIEDDEEMENEEAQLFLKDAQSIDAEIEVGGFIEEPMENAEFGRIAAQTAKQVIIQKLKEAEKNIIFDEFKDKVNELINGFLQRKTRDALFIDLGRTEGILPAREQSPLEHFKIGDRVKALILNVDKNAKGPSIVLSRGNPRFVEKLFEMEIPEIYDGIVRIVGWVGAGVPIRG